jgi:hypothetical protein
VVVATSCASICEAVFNGMFPNCFARNNKKNSNRGL